MGIGNWWLVIRDEGLGIENQIPQPLITDY